MNRRDALKNTALALGYAVSGSALTGMLNGCKADPSPDWTPTFFTDQQMVLITDLADTILPKTETPGAKDVLVHRFIDKMLAGAYTKEEQALWQQEITQFEADCKSMNGKKFTACNAEEKAQLLQKYEAESAKQPGNIWGSSLGDGSRIPFYRQFKGLTLLGYFASEEIGKNHLTYAPIPGAYEPCIPLAEVGNVSAL